jgi:acyl phosphate:glycerol-3-phosphate acyltransferase
MSRPREVRKCYKAKKPRVTMSRFLTIAAISYLLGSIPFGYLLVRIFRGEDVRRTGSGNIGATNVSRTSPLLGVLTLLLDAAKGVAAILLARIIADHTTAGSSRYELLACAALFAIVGHMFPVWLRFRGGKGVATALGSFSLIAPKGVLVAAAVFVVILMLFRYVSLGSIVAAAVFPLIVWYLHQFAVSTAGIVIIAIASLLIIFRHHKNIGRLLAGTENRLGAKRS